MLNGLRVGEMIEPYLVVLRIEIGDCVSADPWKKDEMVVVGATQRN